MTTLPPSLEHLLAAPDRSAIDREAATLSEFGIIMDTNPTPRYSMANVLLNRWETFIGKLRRFARSHDGQWALFGLGAIVITIIILL
jgi:hypothetical protein